MPQGIPTRLQKNPAFYSAPANRDRTRVEIFKSIGKVHEVRGPGAQVYLSREPFPAMEDERGFNTRHFYHPDPSATAPLPRAFHDRIPKKMSGVKTVPVFGDITLIHNTASLNQLDPTGEMKENPMLALNRPHARVFELIDGQRTARNIYDQIIHEYGHEIEPHFFLLFLDHLESSRFIRWSGAAVPALMDRVLSKRWDVNIATVQDQFAYTELPLYTAIEMAYQCNLNCRGCYCRKFPSTKPFRGVEFKQHILKPVIESGVSYVTLLGGEVLLNRPLVADAITRLRSADVYVKLITNGTLVDEETAAALSQAGINKVEISFDGFDAETNDRYRGKGVFDQSVRALKLLNKETIPVIGISVTVHSDNLESVTRDLEAFVLTHGIHKVYFSKFYSSLSGDHRELSVQQAEILAEKCHGWTTRLSKEMPRFEAVVLGRGCTCGRSSAVISPNGMVKACPFSAQPAGSLAQGNGLRSIWENSDVLWHIREMSKDRCAARDARNSENNDSRRKRPTAG